MRFAFLALALPLLAQTPRAPLQVGTAAWYGPPFHSRATASGEVFDMFALTAAHRELPLGTLVRVTNLENRRAVLVRINDRGPFGQPMRIIDLSYAASRQLGIVRKGLARVRLDLISAVAPPAGN